MKNSVTAMYMEALAEKNLGELCYIIFSRTITLNFLAKGGEQMENVKETAKNCLKMFKKVISCFSSVLFLVLSVPDGTLGLKDTERVGPSWLVQNNGFSASSIFS